MSAYALHARGLKVSELFASGAWVASQLCVQPIAPIEWIPRTSWPGVRIPRKDASGDEARQGLTSQSLCHIRLLSQRTARLVGVDVGEDGVHALRSSELVGLRPEAQHVIQGDPTVAVRVDLGMHLSDLLRCESKRLGGNIVGYGRELRNTIVEGLGDIIGDKGGLLRVIGETTPDRASDERGAAHHPNKWHSGWGAVITKKGGDHRVVCKFVELLLEFNPRRLI